MFFDIKKIKQLKKNYGMKKIIFFSLLAIILVSCEGCDPINPPEPPPVVVTVKKFTVTTNVIGGHGTVSPSFVVVDSGKTVKLNVSPEFGYLVDTIKVNNTPLPTSTEVTLEVTSDKKVDISFKYKYEKGTPEWYLTQFVWVESGNFMFYNDIWYDFTIKDPLLISKFWWNPDGTYNQEWNNRKIKGSWSFDKTANPIILIATSRFDSKIEFTDSTKMTLSFKNGNTDNKVTYSNDGIRRFK